MSNHEVDNSNRMDVIKQIQKLDPAYEDIDLSHHSYGQLLNLLNYIETDPDNPNNDEQKEIDAIPLDDWEACLYREPAILPLFRKGN